MAFKTKTLKFYYISNLFKLTNEKKLQSWPLKFNSKFISQVENV